MEFYSRTKCEISDYDSIKYQKKSVGLNIGVFYPYVFAVARPFYGRHLNKDWNLLII